MFVDVIGASEISNHKSPEQYARFVGEFQEMFKRVCALYLKAWYAGYTEADYEVTARGDEGLFMLYLPDSLGDVSTEVDCAVNVALELKRQWLCSSENTKRIEEHGLLPIDLGIGIHVGKTFLYGQDGDKGPEGYAINLAKRVESFSRSGRFTRIFLSAAAFGWLSKLADEWTYLFGSPRTFRPTGISRDIELYELKHHFLPSDWKEESAARKRARSLLYPGSIDVDTLERALELNPTNLWLLDEFIRSSMLTEYWRLSESERESKEALALAFSKALERASLLRESEQRDAGAIFIEALIIGECGDYEQERRKYTEAIAHSDQVTLAYWYRGQATSYDVWEKLGETTNVQYADLDSSVQRLVDKAIDDLREARERRPRSAWMLYDYGCELVRWQRTDAERESGLEQLELAMNRLEEVRESARDEPYLDTVRDEPRIRRLLQKDADRS